MCDWSSCVCSSALGDVAVRDVAGSRRQEPPIPSRPIQELASVQGRRIGSRRIARLAPWNDAKVFLLRHGGDPGDRRCAPTRFGAHPASSCLFFGNIGSDERRSEEHTSELQSLMRISYAVFCLKKKKHTKHTPPKYTCKPTSPQADTLGT